MCRIPHFYVKKAKKLESRAAPEAANGFIIVTFWELLGRVAPPGTRFTPFSPILMNFSGIPPIFAEFW